MAEQENRETAEQLPSDNIGKSKAQEEFSNLHPLRARLYDNVHLSLNTMNIVVAVVAIALIAVFIYGVATGTRA